MKIAYILSTCEKYKTTRVQYQLDTYLKYVNQEDIYYLSCKMDVPNRIFGWDTLDDDKNIMYKYLGFFQNMTLDYDWYFFGDDDTFVFHNRLLNMVEEYDCNDNYYIGSVLDHVKTAWCSYMSGGAGYMISKSLYQRIIEYVRSNPVQVTYQHWCDDLCIGMWIVELNKSTPVHTIHHTGFHHERHASEEELMSAITFHHVFTKEQYNVYYRQLNLEATTVVLVSDQCYWNRALRTIQDLRTLGKWNGAIHIISLDFDISDNYVKEYHLTQIKFPKLDNSHLLSQIGKGFSNSDGREIYKLLQWEKFHVFDEYFKQWKRVIYMDAGLRVLDSMDYLLELNFKGKFVCPNDQGDGPIKNRKVFNEQISHDNAEMVHQIVTEYGDILSSDYFLNCIWIYDTEILNQINKQHFIDVMNKYPLFKTNEMGVMNIVLHFKMNLWEKFPYKASNDKYLFDWSDFNRPGSKCSEYCFIKYPSIGLLHM